MAQAASISLSKFTETVQAAVKVAVQKHPKFKLEQPTQLSISYLIRGIPVPDAIAGNGRFERLRHSQTRLRRSSAPEVSLEQQVWLAPSRARSTLTAVTSSSASLPFPKF